MIVRISGDGQYSVTKDLYDRLTEIDGRTDGHVHAGDGESFEATLAEAIGAVREAGERLPDDRFATADLVIPPAAKPVFTFPPFFIPNEFFSFTLWRIPINRF
jgi:hypothetical protein